MPQASAVNETLKTFFTRLSLLLISIAAFAAAVGLDAMRPASTQSGGINAGALAQLVKQEPSLWARPLANAVRDASREMQISHFDSADQLFRSVVRVLRRKPQPKTDVVEEWIALPQKRVDTVNRFQGALKTLDENTKAILDRMPDASEEQRRLDRDRLTHLLIRRELAEANYRMELAQIDLRASELEQGLRETLSRPLQRLDAFSRIGRQRKPMVAAIRGSLTDPTAPLFPIYEVLWYAALTIAVFSFATFLYQTIIRLLPAETEATLRERVDTIVNKAPVSSGVVPGRTSAMVGLAALGLSAAAVLPSASSVLLDPWQMPITTFGNFSSFAPWSSGMDGAAGTDGAPGTPGGIGNTGGTGAAGAAGAAGRDGRDSGLWFHQSLRIEKIEVAAADQWTSPIETAKQELAERIRTTADSAIAYTDAKHSDAVNRVTTLDQRLTPAEQRLDSQILLTNTLRTDADKLKDESTEYSSADRDDISQAQIWDSRPWWRAFRTLYAAGPISTRVIRKEYPFLAKSFERMSSGALIPKGMPRREFLSTLYQTMYDVGEATSPANAAQIVRTKKAEQFILKTCRVER